MKNPDQVDPAGLSAYDLIGFGSGNYFGKLHKTLLELADRLPQTSNKKAFIFSTSGDTRDKTFKSHTRLKTALQARGYEITGEFNCAGFDTFGALRIVGGVNKGRPNEEDLRKAEAFAKNLEEKTAA